MVNLATYYSMNVQFENRRSGNLWGCYVPPCLLPYKDLLNCLELIDKNGLVNDIVKGQGVIQNWLTTKGVLITTLTGTLDGFGTLGLEISNYSGAQLLIDEAKRLNLPTAHLEEILDRVPFVRAFNED